MDAHTMPHVPICSLCMCSVHVRRNIVMHTTRLHIINRFVLTQAGITLFLISTALKFMISTALYFMLLPSSNFTQKHLNPT